MLLRNVGSLSTDYTSLYPITAVINSNSDKTFTHNAMIAYEMRRIFKSNLSR
jgi:hypothetical protein